MSNSWNFVGCYESPANIGTPQANANFLKADSSGGTMADCFNTAQQLGKAFVISKRDASGNIQCFVKDSSGNPNVDLKTYGISAPDALSATATCKGYPQPETGGTDMTQIVGDSGVAVYVQLDTSLGKTGWSVGQDGTFPTPFHVDDPALGYNTLDSTFLENNAQIQYYASRYAQLINIYNQISAMGTAYTGTTTLVDVSNAILTVNKNLQVMISDMLQDASQNNAICSSNSTNLITELKYLQNEYNVLMGQSSEKQTLMTTIMQRENTLAGYSTTYDAMLYTLIAGAVGIFLLAL
jgi:hypothetical protein